MRNYIPVLILLLLFSCNTTKVVNTPQVKEADTTVCQFVATLLDYTTSQSCGYLFELADGTKLLPSTMPAVDIGFMNKKKVLIGYRTLDGFNTKTDSNCNVEDKVVEITCIKEYVNPDKKEVLNLEDCEQVVNVYTSPWMPAVAEKLKPIKIYEYDYAIGYLYLFEASEVSTLYDCLGNMMCDTSDNGDCKSLISTIGKGKLIQVLSN